MENWYDIKGWEGAYQISDNLRFRSLDRVSPIKTGGYVNQKSKIMTIMYNGRKYPTVYFTKNNKQKQYYVHVLVAMQFIPNPNNKPQLNHINGNKHDFSIPNLEWCTASENALHAYATGLMKRVVGKENPTYGGRNGMAKIVLDTQTGIFYDCSKDASDACGIKLGTLRKWMSKGNSYKTSMMYV